VTLFYKRNRAACLVGLAALVVVVVTTGLFIQKLQNSIVETRRAYELAEMQQQETEIQRQEAVAQRQEAERRRQEAEVALARYRKELNRNMSLLGTLAGNLEFEALELSRILIYSDPIRALELSIQRYKFLQSKEPNPYRMSQIGYCYFVMQDFAKANEYFEFNDGSRAWLHDISRKYEQLKPGDLLGIDQLANLIDDIHASKTSWKPLMEKMLVCDNELREDKTGYEKVVRAVLAGWNTRWTQGQFEYNPGRGSLLLRGDQLKQFAMSSDESSGQSPLRFLSIQSLDAQRTGLHDLNQIKSLPIQSLDIRRTKVTDLEPINLFTSLRTLIIARDQFSAEQLSELPETVTVDIRD
jgi:hypothetical protein